MGEIPADNGEVTIAKDATIGYLAQHQDLSSENTIFDELLTVKREILEMERKMRSLELQMKSLTGDALETAMKSYSNLTHRFEIENGYAYKSEITGVLKGLGFTEEDFKKSVATLSGGRKPEFPSENFFYPNRILFFLTNLPTTWISVLSPGWKAIFPTTTELLSS